MRRLVFWAAAVVAPSAAIVGVLYMPVWFFFGYATAMLAMSLSTIGRWARDRKEVL